MEKLQLVGVAVNSAPGDHDDRNLREAVTRVILTGASTIGAARGTRRGAGRVASSGIATLAAVGEWVASCHWLGTKEHEQTKKGMAERKGCV